MAEITTLVLTDGFVCRYGGEEFVMVIKDEEANTAFDKLEILRRRIENEKFEFEGEKMNVTVSIGAVKYKEGIKLEK